MQYYKFIEIAVKQCRQSGIDCKVHGLSVIGRFRSDDDSAAGFSFLASDREEEEEEKQTPQTWKRGKVKSSGGKDIQTHVFAWGLNDKDQLGGPKGSKVRIWVYESGPSIIKSSFMFDSVCAELDLVSNCILSV